MSKLSHVDSSGNPRMVDISQKSATVRTALARMEVLLPPKIDELFDGDDVVTKKGSVKQTAIIAATMAVKKTSEVVPFCHSLSVESCQVFIEKKPKKIEIQCEVKTTEKTGVEMEALYGCQVAALTVYDMLKAVSHQMILTNLSLLHKTGGKSDLVNEKPSS